MQFRVATVGDLSAVHALVTSGYRGDSARRGWTHEADLLGGQRIDVDGLRAMVTDPRSDILLGFEGEKLVACVQVVAKADQRGYLGMLTVDPTRQAGGLGRQVIAEAERYVKAVWGCRTMEMTVIVQRAELIAYYERRGYRNTGRREPFPLDDERFGLPFRRDLEFVVMEKTLL